MDVSTSLSTKTRDNNESIVTSCSTKLEKTVNNDNTNINNNNASILTNNNKDDNINLGIVTTTKKHKKDKKDKKIKKSKVKCNGKGKKGSKYYKQLMKNGKKMYQCRNCPQIYGTGSAAQHHYINKHTTRFQCTFKG